MNMEGMSISERRAAITRQQQERKSAAKRKEEEWERTHPRWNDFSRNQKRNMRKKLKRL